MFPRITLFTACMLAMALGSSIAAPPSQSAVPPKLESGSFHLSIQSVPAGTERFTLSGHDQYDIDVQVSLPSLKLHEVAKLAFKKDTVVSASLTAAPGGSADLHVNGHKAVLQLRGATTIRKVIPWAKSTALFGNFMPSLATKLLENAHLKVNDEKPVNLLILDSVTPITGKLARKADMTVPVNQHGFTVRHYVLTLAGALGNIDINLYSDTIDQLQMWYVPSQQYLAVLTGSESLASSILHQKISSTAAPPKVRVTDNVQIPMRDGLKLTATVTLPEAPGRYPVILERTPYGRTNTLDGAQFAAHGYAVVVEDVRGRYQSPGKWLPFMNEANDGQDTVKWCAQQPWSNGKVGMFGASYGAYVQWAAAQNGVGALRCILPLVSPPNPLMNVPYEQGELALENDVWWCAIADGKTNGSIKTFSNIKPFYTLPITAVPKAVLGRDSPIMQWWFAHPPSSNVWKSADFNRAMAKMGPLPALMVSGWFDGDGIGTDINFHDMVASGHANQHVIFGPWTHALGSSTHFQGRNFGTGSQLPLNKIYLEWLNYWLKGEQNGIEDMPAVQAFIMGINRWRSFSAWPPKHAELQRWYFHASAKSAVAMPVLNTSIPRRVLQWVRYDYNPAQPVTQQQLYTSAKARSRVTRQRAILRFVSRPLVKPLVVAGPLTLHLWAASSARDTDWIAVLEDVPPKGPPFFLARGIVRAIYRHGFSAPTLLTPNKPVLYRLNMWATGNAFMPGHRIEVVVTSSLFPDFARNLNTGNVAADATKMVTAHQRIYCSKNHRSYIILPVIPAEEKS